MAHQLDQCEGQFCYAFTGERADIWHREGIQMPDDATVVEMADAAGMRFRLLPTRVRYYTGPEETEPLSVFDDKVVLVHSRKRAGLAVVGKDFKIVQPKDLVELAERIARAVDGRVDSAGVTFGGLGLFLNIRASDAERVVGGDYMMPNLLLATRNDGTMQTAIKSSNIRAVCNNTIQAALGSGQHARDFNLSHRSVFDPKKIANFWTHELALHKEQLEKFRELAGTAVRQSTAERIIFNMFNDQRAPAARQDPTVATVPSGKVDIRNTDGYRTILGLFAGQGRGANLPMVKGTAWGLFNAVTEYVDHHARAKSPSQRWMNANFGKGVGMKEDVFNRLMAFAHDTVEV